MKKMNGFDQIKVLFCENYIRNSFGCISLALVSIIVGIIAPKPPVSVIIKAPDGSEFTNSATYNLQNQNI